LFAQDQAATATCGLKLETKDTTLAPSVNLLNKLPFNVWYKLL
jgi:hypothetical protein